MAHNEPHMAHKEPHVDHSPDPRVALCEPCVALCEPGGASGTDEPRVARSEPCVAQVFLQQCLSIFLVKGITWVGLYGMFDSAYFNVFYCIIPKIKYKIKIHFYIIR